MRRRRSIVLLLAAVLIGGNAAVVQLAAWGAMLVERAQRMEVAAAVASTFDGSAPCRMCRMAESLRDQPSPAAPAGAAKLVKKADAPVVPVFALLVRGGEETALPAWPAVLPPRVSDFVPEPPPPRSLG
jgi:hypothetical protein